MSTHPPSDKEKYKYKDNNKDKEEDNEDDLKLLINSTNFEIGRVAKGSLGVGK